MIIKVRARLDKRRARADGTYPLVASFSVFGGTALLPLGVSLLSDQWDPRRGVVVSHPQRAVLNNVVATKIGAIADALRTLQYGGHLKSCARASEVKKLVADYLQDPAGVLVGGEGEDAPGSRSLLEVFSEFADSRRAAKTKESYKDTLSKLAAYLSARDLSELLPGELEVGIIRDFESELYARGLAVNSISIHLRNLRAVCNYAIDEGLTEKYPFRRYRIRQQATRKRSLSVEELREFLRADVTPDQALHRDVFLLIFLLLGINVVDLSQLKEIEDGRIEYRRRKTGRLYSVKVEPEALAIINKYRGRDHLLEVFDRYSSHADYLQHLNRSLKTIGRTTIGARGVRSFAPLQPEISSYWARHSWATIAASLDIPKEVISHALGHGNNSVTDIYIDFDRAKVDRANRRVIDWVLYGKK